VSKVAQSADLGMFERKGKPPPHPHTHHTHHTHHPHHTHHTHQDKAVLQRQDLQKNVLKRQGRLVSFDCGSL
jgi:hypothetical protein